MNYGNDRDDTSSGQGSFIRRALIATGIGTLIALLLLLLWYGIDVLLLAFAGILLAVFLRGLSDQLNRFTSLSGGWSLAIVVLGLLLIFSAGLWFCASKVAVQVDVLRESLPRSTQRLEQYIGQYGWGRQLLGQLPATNKMLSYRGDVLGRVTGIFSSTLGLITNFIIILFVGFYLAVEPRLYTNGLVKLVPIEKRGRICEVLDAVGQTLQRWLIGRIILMIVNGGLTALGLWLLGVPLALTLGLLAGLLNFVPNVGPIIAGVPAVLLALTQSPTQALYVLALYLVLQSADGYVFTPLVQRRTVQLPPALTIMAQVFLGVLVGGLGLLLATPLTAAVFVIVKMLYVEDTLGDTSESNSNQSQA